MKYIISLFTCKTDNAPKLHEITWDQLVYRAKHPHVRADKDGVLISGAKFDKVDPDRGIVRRAIVCASESSMIFGDVDHGATFDDCLDLASKVTFHSLLYTTHSHRIKTDNNPKAEDRIRWIVPLAVPVSAEMFPLLWRWLQKELNSCLDPACKDISRIVYAPSVSAADAPYDWIDVEGPLLDWRTIDLQPFREKPRQPVSIETVQSAGWEDLRARLREKIRNHETARENGRGKVECQGICHDGKSKTALFINKEGVIWCTAGCNLRDILRAFGLPDRPERKTVYEKAAHRTHRPVMIPSLKG